MHRHPGLLVHAGDEVPGVAMDVHLDRTIESGTDAVLSVGVLDTDPGDVGTGQFSVQVPIQFANARRGQIEFPAVTHETTAVVWVDPASTTDHE